MDIEIGYRGHGKDVVDGINYINKSHLRKHMNRSSKSLTRTCESLGMIHSAYNKSTVIFAKTMQVNFNRIFSYCR